MKYAYFYKFLLGLVVSFSFSQVLTAQVFVYTTNADMLLGFRKTGTNQANFEAVVNIGSVTNYENMAGGTTTNLGNYFTPIQLGNAFSNLNNLSWSVSGAFAGNSPFAGYPRGTLWLTNPRSDPAVQSTPYTRANLTTQGNVRQNILGIGSGAVAISTALGATSTNNTATYVREPINDPSDLTALIGGQFDASLSDYKGQWTQSVEGTTLASFTSPVRTDLYESRPTGNVDPHSGSTTGSAYFVGYFELGTNGTVTFTRASSNSLPPAPTLTISRTGNTSTISFTSTNGATYNLIFTNIAGLSSALSNWPASGGSIIGNGGTTNFTDTTTDPDRVYSVTAH